MTCSEALRARGTFNICPIYRKTGPRMAGFKAFTRDHAVESVMDAIPEIAAVVEACEAAGIAEWELDRLRYRLCRES